MPKTICLQDPLQARRWLKLLIADVECGFRLAPGVTAPSGLLGFSFSSNKLGLHGPCDEYADNVVFGTSYAMGIAVNENENWHALPELSEDWLNLGLPVGVREWDCLLRRYSRGRRKHAVLIYHPNIWQHCQMYERWRASNQDVFTALRWRRDLLGCTHLYIKKIARRKKAIHEGALLSFQNDNQLYEIDTRYAYIDPEINRELIQRNLSLLYELLQPFAEVTCVRVPIKQELVPQAFRNDTLIRTLKSYDSLWEETKKRLSSLTLPRFFYPTDFTVADFHPFDSHWNAAGNAKFANWFRTILDRS